MPNVYDERHYLLIRNATLAEGIGAAANLVDFVYNDPDDRVLVGLRLLYGPRGELHADSARRIERLDLNAFLRGEAVADVLLVGLSRPRASVDGRGSIEELEDAAGA